MLERGAHRDFLIVRHGLTAGGPPGERELIPAVALPQAFSALVGTVGAEPASAMGEKVGDTLAERRDAGVRPAHPM